MLDPAPPPSAAFAVGRGATGDRRTTVDARSAPRAASGILANLARRPSAIAGLTGGRVAGLIGIRIFALVLIAVPVVIVTVVTVVSGRRRVGVGGQVVISAAGVGDDRAVVIGNAVRNRGRPSVPASTAPRTRAVSQPSNASWSGYRTAVGRGSMNNRPPSSRAMATLAADCGRGQAEEVPALQKTEKGQVQGQEA